MTQHAAIIIPARYGSTRFEGKPLALLAGQPMLTHVYARAQMAVEALRQGQTAIKDAEIVIAVATDDERIADLCQERGFDFVMTSPDCRTGSDRVLEAVHALNEQRRQTGHEALDIVLNLQGDNPFASTEAIQKVLAHLIDYPEHEVATPVLPLSWGALDSIRTQKEQAPFSGTTVVLDAAYKALWFSKQILPAIRKEDTLRTKDILSPVHRHIGLYGYRVAALETFVSLPEGRYEALEGLEQLRFLENGIDIYGCPIAPESMPPLSGIDTESDMQQAETLIMQGKIDLPNF